MNESHHLCKNVQITKFSDVTLVKSFLVTFVNQINQSLIIYTP